MANYSKNKKAKSSQELYYNCNRRKLELRKVRKYRRDSEKIREVRNKDRREV